LNEERPLVFQEIMKILSLERTVVEGVGTCWGGIRILFQLQNLLWKRAQKGKE